MKWSGNGIAMYLSSPSSPPGLFRTGSYFQAERERKTQCSSKIHRKTPPHIVERKKKTSWDHTMKIQNLVRQKENKISFELDLTAQSRHPKCSQHPPIHDRRDGALPVKEDAKWVPGSLEALQVQFVACAVNSHRSEKLEPGCHSERQLQCHINP